MLTFADLTTTLSRIDGRGYKAYKEISGAFSHDQFTLFVDHVQGDPFAAPTKIRVRVSSAVSDIPQELFSNRIRRIALQDFLIRAIDHAIHQYCQGNRGIGKSGLMSIDVGGQEILERTAMVVTNQWLEARMEVGLPAAGRTILGKQAEAMLCQELPNIVSASMRWKALDQKQCTDFVNCVENQEAIRDQLDSFGLIAFVADGALLARASGASDLPMKGECAHVFQSPQSLRVEIPVPHEVEQHHRLTRIVAGLGLPKGVTLIVGGGYHGKSTLLRALERGVYPHIPGDGREYVITVNSAVKVRAEDGRRVEAVDISGFMTNLPFHQDTTCFYTENASGSTSQAATILEAIEVQSKVLLLDEDTSATNFMIRDARMQRLVHKDHEPITPFIDRIRELHDTFHVSTVLVMGGCGDYFDVADTVIMMQEFQPFVVTTEALQIARDQDTKRHKEVKGIITKPRLRLIQKNSVDASSGHRHAKIEARSLNFMTFGREAIDLSGVDQLVDISQTRAIGYALVLLANKMEECYIGIAEAVRFLDELFCHQGLDSLHVYGQTGRHPGNFARPRPYEIASAINRLRAIRLCQTD